jgi:DNA polymerase (family 10)
MGIESLGELLYACRENRLKLYKGFGEKTQQNLTDSIEFYMKHKESHLYAQAAPLVPVVTAFLEKQFGAERVRLTGKWVRQLEVIDHLEFVVASEPEAIIQKLTGSGTFQKTKEEDFIEFSCEDGIALRIYPSSPEWMVARSVLLSSSPEFAARLEKTAGGAKVLSGLSNETELFTKAGLPFVSAPRREDPDLMNQMKGPNPPGRPIELKDIKGLIHCHSTWSDGGNSPEELAQACLDRGLEYMVLSDHSQSAFYAQGLKEDRILAQHEEIDELNQKLKPFKIFKSIECDILNDGSLDYSEKILRRFDLVIASVHSNLSMNEEKAMERLLRAIENPYTTILGHMTGRLLLSRAGYPVDHERIIEACRKNKVAIELNANPHRLDIDWRHINKALEAGVYISINPDAHSIEGIDDLIYGVLQAQKTLLSPDRNLSSFSLAAFEQYLIQHKK